MGFQRKQQTKQVPKNIILANCSIFVSFVNETLFQTSVLSYLNNCHIGKSNERYQGRYIREFKVILYVHFCFDRYMLYNLLIIYLKNDLLRSESCPQAKMLQIESITFEKKASEEPFF